MDYSSIYPLLSVKAVFLILSFNIVNKGSNVKGVYFRLTWKLN